MIPCMLCVGAAFSACYLQSVSSANFGALLPSVLEQSQGGTKKAEPSPNTSVTVLFAIRGSFVPYATWTTSRSKP
jgi:hypothetical protein